MRVVVTRVCVVWVKRSGRACTRYGRSRAVREAAQVVLGNATVGGVRRRGEVRMLHRPVRTLGELHLPAATVRGALDSVSALDDICLEANGTRSPM